MKPIMLKGRKNLDKLTFDFTLTFLKGFASIVEKWDRDQWCCNSKFYGQKPVLKWPHGYFEMSGY